jgi:hypothetical protein
MFLPIPFKTDDDLRINQLQQNLNTLRPNTPCFAAELIAVNAKCEKLAGRTLSSSVRQKALALSNECLVKRSKAITSQDAARNGKALSLTINASIETARGSLLFGTSSPSANRVFIDDKVVAKEWHTERFREEEELTTQLARLMISDQNIYVPSFPVQNLSLPHFGQDVLPATLQPIACDVGLLSKKAFNAIAKNLSCSPLAIRRSTTTPLPEESFRASSPPITQDGFYPHLYQYARTHKGSIFVLPDLDLINPNVQKELFSLANTSWIVASVVENEEYTFQELLYQFLDEKINSNTLIGTKKEVEENPLQNNLKPLSSYKMLFVFLSGAIPWRIYSSQPFLDPDNMGRTPRPLSCKPYVDMLLFNDLIHKELNEEILADLNPEGEEGLVSTLILQFLDFHAQNLGFRVVNPEFEDSHFQIEGRDKMQTLSDLALLHRDERIYLTDKSIRAIRTPDTPMRPRLVFSRDSDGTPSYNVKLSPSALQDETADLEVRSARLMQTLTKSLTPVIFDSDNALAEDNLLENMLIGDKKIHFIPLCNCLLETSWAQEIPLRNNTIRSLLNLKEKVTKEVLPWIDLKLGWPYSHMSQEGQNEIHKHLLELYSAPKFSLTQFRKHDPDRSITSLRKFFAADIALSDSYVKGTFWNLFQKHLLQGSKGKSSFFKLTLVEKEIELEALSKTLGISQVILKELNPSIENKVKAGTTLFLSPHFLLMNNEGKELRKKALLAITPLVSFRQRRALLQRIESLNSYLENYTSLQEIEKKNAIEKRAIVNKVVTFPSLPLASLEKKELVADFFKSLKSDQELNDFIEKLRKKIQPSFLALAKVMYPLIADQMCLNKYLVEFYQGGKDKISASPGALIGQYSYPLEKLFTLYLKSLLIQNPHLESESLKKLLEKCSTSLDITLVKKAIQIIGEANLGIEKDAFLALFSHLENELARRPPTPYFFYAADEIK